MKDEEELEEDIRTGRLEIVPVKGTGVLGGVNLSAKTFSAVTNCTTEC